MLVLPAFIANQVIRPAIDGILQQLLQLLPLLQGNVLVGLPTDHIVDGAVPSHDLVKDGVPSCGGLLVLDPVGPDPLHGSGVFCRHIRQRYFLCYRRIHSIRRSRFCIRPGQPQVVQIGPACVLGGCHTNRILSGVQLQHQAVGLPVRPAVGSSKGQGPGVRAVVALQCHGTNCAAAVGKTQINPVISFRRCLYRPGDSAALHIVHVDISAGKGTGVGGFRCGKLQRRMLCKIDVVIYGALLDKAVAPAHQIILQDLYIRLVHLPVSCQIPEGGIARRKTGDIAQYIGFQQLQVHGVDHAVAVQISVQPEAVRRNGLLHAVFRQHCAAGCQHAQRHQSGTPPAALVRNVHIQFPPVSGVLPGSCLFSSLLSA